MEGDGYEPIDIGEAAFGAELLGGLMAEVDGQLLVTVILELVDEALRRAFLLESQEGHYAVDGGITCKGRLDGACAAGQTMAVSEAIDAEVGFPLLEGYAAKWADARVEKPEQIIPNRPEQMHYLLPSIPDTLKGSKPPNCDQTGTPSLMAET